MASLTGRTALATGGGRGIGAAVVRLLALEEAQVAFAWCRVTGNVTGAAGGLTF